MTAPGERLIELDANETWPPPGRPPPRPGSRIAWLPAAVGVVLALGLLGGGQYSAPLTPLLVVQGTGVQRAIAATRSIFVLHQPNQGSALLAAYRLADGEHRWSQAFPPAVQLVYADDRAVVLDTGVTTPSVTGVDPATGAVRWRRDGFQPIRGSRAVVVAEHFDDNRGEAPTREVTGLHPVTGATVWQFRTPVSTDMAFLADEGGRERIAEYDQDGLLRLRDLGTGQVTSVVRLPGLDVRHRYVIVGNLVVSVQEVEGSWSAYDMESGDLVWWRVFEGDASLNSCGPVLCLIRPGSIAGVDRATGRELWHLAGFRAYKPLGDGLMAVTSTLEYDRSALVVDAASGRIKSRIGGWIPLAGTGRGALIGWRPSPGGGAAIALLDAATGAARVFGTSVDWFPGSDCSVSQAHLACLGPIRLSIWRLPNAAQAGKMS